MSMNRPFDFEDKKTISKLKKMSLPDFKIAIKNAININNCIFVQEMNDINKLNIWIDNGGDLTFIEHKNNLLPNISVEKLKFLAEHNYKFLYQPFYLINETLKKDNNFNYFLYDFPEKTERYFEVLSEVFRESILNKRKERIAAIYDIYSDKHIFERGKNSSFHLLDSDILYFIYKKGIINENDIVSQNRLLFIQNQRLSSFETQLKKAECEIQDLKRFNNKIANQKIKSSIVSFKEAQKNIAETVQKINFYTEIGGTPEKLYTYLRDRLIEEQRSQLNNLFNQKVEQNLNSLYQKRL